MNIEYTENAVKLSGVNINADLVFDCGQAFRFDRDETGCWRGVAHGREIAISASENSFTIYPCNEADFNNIWRDYFDLDFDYDAMENSLSCDPVFSEARKACPGMRILHQDPFEVLISFIISANNNIRRIKKIIAAICERSGERLPGGGYIFPTPEALMHMSEAELAACGCGYRAPYIMSTARTVAEGEFDISAPATMEYGEAKKLLMTLKGVGPKVADCVLLFGYQRRIAFPKDVWIRRVLKTLYGVELTGEAQLCEFAEQKFGENAGMAQQYLFHYARTIGNEKNDSL